MYTNSILRAVHVRVHVDKYMYSELCDNIHVCAIFVHTYRNKNFEAQFIHSAHILWYL